MSISIEASAKVTFQEAMEVLLSNFTDKFVLLLDWIKTCLLGILLILIYLIHLLLFLNKIISVSLGI